MTAVSVSIGEEIGIPEGVSRSVTFSASGTPRIEYPVRVLHGGGVLVFNGSTSVSPTYFWDGSIGDLRELSVIQSANDSLLVSVQESVDKYIEDNPGAVLTYASLEIVLVDASNKVVGWATTATNPVVPGISSGLGGFFLTASLRFFPETSNSWIVPLGFGGTSAAPEPIGPILPLTPYKTVVIPAIP